MNNIHTAAALGLIFAIALGSIGELAGRVEGLQENVLRLHILAASDSEEDQALKLQVRDALLAQSEALFGDCKSLAEMKARAIGEEDRIRALAEETLRENGCTDPVTVEVAETAFPVREYEDFTMPAGTYTALRILIGEGAGQNWWCVMYPPLCLPAASEASAYFDGETVELLEAPETYEVKLKCVEVFQAWRDKHAS